MTVYRLALVAALANAQQNTDTTSDTPRPDWQPTEPKYGGDWKSCTADSDCEADHFCLDHMWAYNGQTESGTGCWTSAVCSGNASFDMFDGRKLQFFCSEEQTTAAAAMSAPWGLTPIEKAFSTFEVACESDADCPIAGSQQCTFILWDATDNGSSYANGVACYNWDEEVCPGGVGEDFASINENYANTQFSHYTEYSCTVQTSSSATTALASVAAVILATVASLF